MGFLAGKKALIAGLASERSIAWVRLVVGVPPAETCCTVREPRSMTAIWLDEAWAT